jgi:hypothetical protein
LLFPFQQGQTRNTSLFRHDVVLFDGRDDSKIEYCRRHLKNGRALAGSCCRDDDEKASRKPQLRCLPSFIIAGVQKGGTTALSGLMCTLPQISFSIRKEVHFFDHNERYKKGIKEYIKSFKPWNYSDIHIERLQRDPYALPTWKMPNPPLFAESTPFYIASRDSCRRISESLPGVKMILLLREPVARAYSEYQMKKR